MPYPLTLALALLLTEAIEISICLLWGFRGRDLLFVLLANVLTNPLVNVLYAGAGVFTSIPPALALAALEGFAVAAEWLVYRFATERKRPFLVSLSANAASFCAGLLITTLFS